MKLEHKAKVDTNKVAKNGEIKHKPLDGCRVYPVPIDYGEDFELVKDENGEVFLYDEVKDAVQGLLDEIEEKKKPFKAQINENAWARGYLRALKESEDLIKKWLKDVVE